MPSPLQHFLRRLLVLSGARRALASGAPERALAALEDPLLGPSTAARRLRAEALELLCREALLRSVQGRARSAARLFGLVAERSPSRARECRQRLAWAGGVDASCFASAPGDPPSARSRPEAPGRAPDADPGSGASARASSGANGSRAASTPADRVASPSAGAARAAAERAALFELSVDEGGQLLVAAGERLVIGHARGDADLAFLADVGARHARLESYESLRSGPGWRIVPLGDEPLTIGGERVEPAGRALADGERVELAVNLAFRFRMPDTTSQSAVLELLRGAECAGCSVVALFAAGPGGRLRIGPTRRAHVRVRRMEREVALELAGNELRVQSAGALSLASAAPPAPTSSAEPVLLRLAFPPTERTELRVGRAGPAGPPLALTIAPSRAGGAP